MGARHDAPRHRDDRTGRTDPEQRRPRRSTRPEISLPQLIGAAVGAAAGMTLASELRLYGTTAGAVVFAVAATVGAPLIQLALHRAGDGCAALLWLARSCRRPGAAALRALVPAAVGALLLGAVTAGGTAAVAAPPSRDPAERGSQDKAVQVRPEPRKSAGRRAS
ncbi:hypothetical protein [Streptomyces boluensis]|uniref:Uncharacterized protein n=1 Tax=Streptomyces boluensis TaxID=1775135 RepID=A0A964UQA1_9ACTN|nr:hypothetical protein [Streptomyces boluensis]NBE52430.1 hypothetical protein [Streptomyces boluensis]